jgi:cation:H+ antiporter
MIVKTAQSFATSLGIPVLLVGLFVVALGTSLPELALEIRAIKEKEVALVFGNLLGSTVANSTLIIGLTALIAPIEVVAVNSYLIATLAYIVLFWLFWWLTKTKRRLDRWEGVVMILGYLVFIAIELVKANGPGKELGMWLSGWWG